MANEKSGLVTLQIEGLDVSSKEVLNKALEGVIPIIAENIMVATAGDRSRGCSVSGTATSGGGFSGTVTCTF